MKILIDMNLSPDWKSVLEHHGWAAIHWSMIGDPCATDKVIMKWAMSNGYIVFTHDLDFGTMLALTHESGPSVFQVRGQNVLPDQMERIVIAAIQQYETNLESGALVVVDESKCRVRILPI